VQALAQEIMPPQWQIRVLWRIYSSISAAFQSKNPLFFMEILPKNLPIFQKYEPSNPLSNPGFDAQEGSYQRIPESPRKIIENSKSGITIV
jgi:hypothetical protein